MKKFPEWVPEDAIEYYWQRCEPRESTDDLYRDELDRLGTEMLCRAMESANMRKAWEAIARREDKVRPLFFAMTIEDAVRAVGQISTVPPPEQIATFRELTAKVKALSPEFERALGHWCDEVMLHYFEVRPDNAVKELAENMEEFTSMVEDNRKWFTDLTAKPGSKNAKRTFVIRFLSERINEWYGTPLHDTERENCVPLLVSLIASSDIKIKKESA